ncbi:CCR4-NOT transcription complex subunit 11 [Trichonephila clavipes]|nr:CCR4-NOT transcription complex subunit 11 [Trichonephila clavipes]
MTKCKRKVFLLQQEDLLANKEQRLVSIYLLYEMYRTEPIQSNPFASVFVHLLHPPDEMKCENGETLKRPWALPRISNSEKHFLSQLISMPMKELFKKTPNQVIQMEASNMQSFDVSGLQVAFS